MTIAFGIDVLLGEGANSPALRSARIALVANPASVTATHLHSLDALIENGWNIVKAFGPQHGMRGDKQDNMILSPDYLDPIHQIPIISLYGEHRRPTAEMLADVELVLFDLQDVGCRIYTYSALLRYFLEACHGTRTRMCVLDRPNPAGRPIDGLRLEPGHESIVGFDSLPTRHGLTHGELARWLVARHSLDVDLTVVALRDYRIHAAPGYGWPAFERPWINPSPNASSLNMARCFPGTVLLEGTELSEGRGTTVPLEIIGAPDFPAREVLEHLRANRADWMTGAVVRPCHFEPTFHKHHGVLCEGLQIHTDYRGYQHEEFKPWRLVAGLLKSLRELRPDYPLWRHHAYEFELDRIPVDVINGGPMLRRFVDGNNLSWNDIEQQLEREAVDWEQERAPFLLYE